ncbi:hypothetical protein OA58_16775 [Microcystis aeruginosa NIES-88]|nr:hypothetical protein OA58_16775 [Microcystis aeruginosa NIES-88]
MWEAQIRGLVSLRELFGVSTEIEQSSFLNFIFLRRKIIWHYSSTSEYYVSSYAFKFPSSSTLIKWVGGVKYKMNVGWVEA